MTGRRRIGKSRLAFEFAKQYPFYTFTGLAPITGLSANKQRDEFARQLSEQCNLPKFETNDWGDLFSVLASQVSDQRVIILFDEISWMGNKDPTFLAKLKVAWDTKFKNNPQLILILCGSVSSWVEKNIISSTGFFGRISLKIALDELSLKDCCLLLKTIGFRGSIMEMLIMLSITGGVPWYLELINPHLSPINNIRELCFSPEGILVDEFQHIFHDLFGKRGPVCQKIVSLLAKHPAQHKTISTTLHYGGGVLSDYLHDMVQSGFLSRDFSWSFKTGKDTQCSLYRLRDNYLRFYIRYIEPNLSRIKKGQFQDVSLTALNAWNSIIGLQFENIILQIVKQYNSSSILSLTVLLPIILIYSVQRNSNKVAKLIILFRHSITCCLHVKSNFSRHPIDASIIGAMQQKLARLKLPRGFSCFPVLIHVNGITDAVQDSGYFAKIIDFSELLAY